MPLQSRLFASDARLNACLTIDSQHVTPGSRGDYVAKIQSALNAIIDAGLSVDGIYGEATASAVLDYKNDPSRRLLQPWQTTADNIVGKGTIAFLDREMLAKEVAPEREVFRIRIIRPGARVVDVACRPPLLRNAFSKLRALSPGADAAGGSGAPVLAPAPAVKLRLQPRDFGELLILGAGARGLDCSNSVLDGGDVKQRIAWIWNAAALSPDRLIPEPHGPLVSDFRTDPQIVAYGPRLPYSVGGSVLLTEDQKLVIVDAYLPGDAVITGSNARGAMQSVLVEVRAKSAGPVNRPPLTKLTAGSKYFSASQAEGGEPDPRGVFHGRPVNPRRGGRLINLGGETETPEFEDYQVSLAFSGYQRGGVPVFRPMVDDAEPSIGVANGTASHICMRGTRLHDPFIAAIKRIAAPKALFTYSGDNAQLAINSLPGAVLEKNITKGMVVIELN